MGSDTFGSTENRGRSKVKSKAVGLGLDASRCR